MAIFTLGASANRWIHLVTPIDADDLIAHKISGGESLGRLFEYEVIAISARGDINFDELLSKHLTIVLEVVDGRSARKRYIDGRVSQVSLIGTVGDYYRYRIVLRPWLWMLTRTADCRIFQEKTAREIIEEVFSDQSDTDFEFRLTGNYTPREYCVQYRETDFNFVSRLLEEEGMYYFFEHESGKHKMVICDNPGAHTSVGN